jgi:hypothetical protein
MHCSTQGGLQPGVNCFASEAFDEEEPNNESLLELIYSLLLDIIFVDFETP